MHHSYIQFWLKDFLCTGSEYQRVRIKVNGKCYCNIYDMKSNAGNLKVLLSLSALVKHCILLRTEKESSQQKHKEKNMIRNTQKEINIRALDVMLSPAKKRNPLEFLLKQIHMYIVNVQRTLYNPQWTLLFKCSSVFWILNGIGYYNEENKKRVGVSHSNAIPTPVWISITSTSYMTEIKWAEKRYSTMSSSSRSFLLLLKLCEKIHLLFPKRTQYEKCSLHDDAPRGIAKQQKAQ